MYTASNLATWIAHSNMIRLALTGSQVQGLAHPPSYGTDFKFGPHGKLGFIAGAWALTSTR
jgi:hypothetical protein